MKFQTNVGSNLYWTVNNWNNNWHNLNKCVQIHRIVITETVIRIVLIVFFIVPSSSPPSSSSFIIFTLNRSLVFTLPKFFYVVMFFCFGRLLVHILFLVVCLFVLFLRCKQ
eukprot:m.256729 g.256729  ORF g.256729 m.256729 type:complete len:111 (-) comp34630_c0_seq1:857-1189(-)